MTSDRPAPLNRLKQAWRDKRPTFGAIATIPSVQTVRIMAQSLDWIIVDLEHGPIDLSAAHGLGATAAHRRDTESSHRTEYESSTKQSHPRAFL